ncbi:MAG TPA: hypothetical protein VHZ56_14305, partial [Devosia sp.]|nr:hypothetical protein [Devosia sp.]
FEAALASSDREKARDALRRYLFAAQELPCDGSLSDAIVVISRRPAGRGAAAALVLRALSVPGVVHTSAANLTRSVVELVEGALPELSELVGVDAKQQN